MNYIKNHPAVNSPEHYIKNTEIAILVYNIMKICLNNVNLYKEFGEQVNNNLTKFSSSKKDMMFEAIFYDFLL